MVTTTAGIPAPSEPWRTQLPFRAPRQELASLKAARWWPVCHVFLFETSAVSGDLFSPILSPFPGISAL